MSSDNDTSGWIRKGDGYQITPVNWNDWVLPMALAIVIFYGLVLAFGYCCPNHASNLHCCWKHKGFIRQYSIRQGLQQHAQNQKQQKRTRRVQRKARILNFDSESVSML